MSIVLPVIVVVFDLILPIALLLWALKTRAKSRLYLASIWLSTAVVIAVLTKSIVGFWYVVGVFWPTVYLVAFAAILIVRVRGGLPTVWLPRRWSRELFVTAANILHAGFWALMIPQLLQARSYEGTALSLAPPLRGGQFYVMAGGANASVNQHGDYALDIGKLNALGLSAAGFFPQDLEKYAVFGADVVAPCAGEVISTENTRPNRRPLDPDGEDRTGGNHVVIYCEGHSVQLAHLQPGSVAVSVGDRVSVGQLAGKVGSSGNATEPHLHINAARGRYLFVRSDDRVLTDPQTIPFLIDGRFLVKGESFSN
jgi:peptidase M23-like protein